jgi:hypothetical protein
MRDKIKEKKVIDYIISKNFNKALSGFLIELIKTDIVNENLLCLCMLIDMEYILLNKDQYVEVINELITGGKKVDFNSFISSFAKHEEMLFCCESPRAENYSRVISQPVFFDYIGDKKHKPRAGTFFKPSKKLGINWKQIKKNGWTAIKDIVWVAPCSEIKAVIENSSGNPANDVCDYVGFDRNMKLYDATDHGQFVVIHYSSDFNEKVYQPNASQGKWTDRDTLYISYKIETGFGKAFNKNTNGKNANEHIHIGLEHDTLSDSEFIKIFNNLYAAFEAEYLGQISVDSMFDRNIILEEALLRLGI